jgi:DNA-directed RNA polymerase specialized sigma24 family protein
LDEMPPTGQPADHDFLAEVREHRSRLVRLAYRFCWNRANAEDAVHSALIRAAGRRAQVRDGARVWAWVRAIVVRECQDQRRRQKRDRRAADARIQKEGQPGDAANPAELAARGELTERGSRGDWGITRAAADRRCAATPGRNELRRDCGNHGRQRIDGPRPGPQRPGEPARKTKQKNRAATVRERKKRKAETEPRL